MRVALLPLVREHRVGAAPRAVRGSERLADDGVAVDRRRRDVRRSGRRDTGVAADVPGAEPSGVVAVTVTRIVPPMSADAIVYVPLVAPPMFVQPVPDGPQRFHW